jgi:hypothetical protein
MTEMLMTEASQTNSAEASQTPDNGAYYGGDRVGDNQQQPAPEQEQQAQDAANAVEKPGDQPPSVLGAPEAYELKANVDTFAIDEQIGSAFQEIAKELDLSNAAAQKVVDKVGPVLAARQLEMHQAATAEWGKQSQSDKEFGGEKLPANLAVAEGALKAFATPELRELLQKSGLGNHPEIIRFMYRAGKAISTDDYVGASQGSGASRSAPKDMASYANALYSNQQS